MQLFTREDIRKIFTMKDAIAADKECYAMFSRGAFQTPLRTVIPGSAGNFLFMPAYCEEMGAVGMKVVNIMPENPASGLPASVGQVMLIDSKTGLVTALLDGTYVTALRTGAASGCAFDLFGLKNASVGAVIGTGSQAMTQLEAMLAVRELKEVRIAARDHEKTKAFAEKAKAALSAYGADIIPYKDPDDAVRDADLAALVTGSAAPVCRAASFKPGCTISAVGSYTYDMQELDPGIFKRCGKLYFDSEEAVLSESGDILRPLESGALKREQFTGDIGDYILGKIPGRERDDEIIVFENVGIGALDLTVAKKIYDKAQAMR